MRVIDLAIKDLTQIVRDWRAAAFLLIMPIAFTLLMGFAFGGAGSDEAADARLPVGFLDQDGGRLSPHLLALVDGSKVIRIAEREKSLEELEAMVAEEELAAAIVVPAGYGGTTAADETRPPLIVIADVAGDAGRTAQGEIQAAVMRLDGAVRAAQIGNRAFEGRAGFEDEGAAEAYYDFALAQAVAAWEEPPVAVETRMSGREVEEEGSVFGENAFTHTSPGMMAQFTIAGLTGAAAILVLERKNRSLQRLLTTTISRWEILLGHFVAMFIMIFVQLATLILFGQLFLKVNYLSAPLAMLLMMVTTTLFAASLGLLIGSVARTEDQVVVMTLVLMFLLAGLGGAWVPLEITPEGFQRIAYLTPVAWTMDGFKDIIIRGQGLAEVLQAAGVLFAYAAMLFALAVWRFRFE
jgi:ABC-2 type transport system permease protein